MKIGRVVLISLLFVLTLTISLTVTLFVNPSPLVAPTVPVGSFRAVATPEPTTNIGHTDEVKRIDPALNLAATSSLWFLGDVMLSRQVGQFAEQRGADYSWRKVAGVFKEATVLANFEGCFSPTKVFSYDNSMRFPVSPTLVSAVKAAGITHASLANNHGLDCGQTDLDFTRSHLASSSVVAFGHPTKFSSDSVVYLKLANFRIAIIAIHTLFNQPTNAELAAVVEEAGQKSDLQFVFIHWGEEYKLQANAAQRLLAQELASLGVDLIVGHHPHVTQDIELLGQTVVLYSLGNFIFDQYFSEAVQTGLAAKLEATPSDLRLYLYPVSSLGSKTQPRLLEGTERFNHLQTLGERSDQTIASEIKAGYINLARLATSSKKAIIAQ